MTTPPKTFPPGRLVFVGSGALPFTSIAEEIRDGTMTINEARAEHARRMGLDVEAYLAERHREDLTMGAKLKVFFDPKLAEPWPDERLDP